ncbi:MAG: nucleoid-associated protein [Bacterioplanes sp.]|nr:nucleoid-associated protein [Bacterioplanes sp.]
MTIQHFITHHIQKRSDEPAATLQCSDQEADLQHAVVAHFYQQTLSQLKSTLTQRAGKRYGVFHPEITFVRAQLQNWQQQGQSFLSLTRRLSQQFANQLDNTNLEVEGYLAFIYEQLADSDRMYCFLLRRKSSVSINTDMTLSETHYLDFSNTGFGVMINLTEWQEDDTQPFITFSYGRGDKPLQQQWAEFIGFTDALDSAAETAAFLDIVEQYSQALPQEKSHEYKSKLVDYCLEQDALGEAVNFNELEHYLEKEVTLSQEERPAGASFSHYVIEKQKQRQQLSNELSQAQKNDIGLPSSATDSVKTELIPDRKKLRNYIRYSGKHKDLSISFSASLLDSDVVFDGHKNTLTLHKLPESLLKQLKGQ